MNLFNEKNQSTSNTQIVYREYPTPTTFIPTIVITPTTTPPKANDLTVYQVSIKYKSHVSTSDQYSYPISLPYLLTSVEISNRVYENHKFPNSYFIFSLTNQTYPAIIENETATLSLTQKKQLLPYIQNSSYCVKDQDCSIKTNGCQYGAFNDYENYMPGTGCPFSFDYEQDQTTGKVYQIGEYSDQLKCDTTVTYSSAKCLKNICHAEGRQVTCYAR